MVLLNIIKFQARVFNNVYFYNNNKNNNNDRN